MRLVGGGKSAEPVTGPSLHDCPFRIRQRSLPNVLRRASLNAGFGTDEQTSVALVGMSAIGYPTTDGKSLPPP